MQPHPARLLAHTATRLDRPTVPGLVRALRRLARTIPVAVAATMALSSASGSEPMDSWTPFNLPESVVRSPNDLIFAEGKYWAVGSSGRVQYSTDGGSAWHVVQTPAQGSLFSIAYTQGRFVAVGDYATIMSSPDGAEWTIHHQVGTSSPRYRDVIYAGGKFVAVGGQGMVQYSADGTSWTPVSIPNSTMTMTGVAWGNGLFVASGELRGTQCIATSPDGITWTARNVSGANGYKAVGWFNGLFIAGNVSELSTSPDGLQWTRLNQVSFAYSNMTILGIKQLNGRAFVFGMSGLLMSSPDGAGWTTHTTGTTLNIKVLDYNGERLLAFRTGASANSGTPVVSDPWAPVGGAAGSSQLANLSTRAWIGAGDAQLISGLVVAGSTPKTVLVRAIGPTLATYGVTGVLVDPRLRLVDHSQAEIASNDDWGTFSDQSGMLAASDGVGAFPLDAGSKDAALVATLQPGSYSIQVSGANGATGIALVEIYDVDAPGGCRLVNISSRGYVGSGSEVAIPGFVVSGSAPRQLLIRGVGPTLGSFGVPGTIANPTIALYDAAQSKVADNDDWSTAPGQAAMAAAVDAVGAFPLNPGSADAAMLVTVQPGAYTVTVSGVNGASGIALVEIYEVP